MATGGDAVPDAGQGLGARPEVVVVGRRLVSLAVAYVWFAAVYVLLWRDHQVLRYRVSPGDAPALLSLAVALTLAAVLGWGAWRQAARTQRLAVRAHGWLLAVGWIPLKALVAGGNAAGWLAPTFVEPFFAAFVTGECLRLIFPTPESARGSDTDRRRPGVVWGWCVVAAAVGFAVFAFARSCQAYNEFLLGFPDFGHFARRVINTWEGRGFLQQAPHLPAFGDHFNPGMVLFAPLWGLWPRAHLFMALQAASLAAPALAVWAIARRLGGDSVSAMLWAIAYLLYPAVSLLNLNMSYGWHPESTTIPALFLALGALVAGRRGWALVFAVVACCFKEDAIVVVAGLCLALAVIRRRYGPGAVETPAGQHAPDGGPLVGPLGWRGWLAWATAFALAFVVVWTMSGFADYQMQRLGVSGAGNSGWGAWILSVLGGAGRRLFRLRSVYFLLALSVPLGVAAVGAGWPLLLALVCPVAVLLAWDFDAATCIAFQYTTTLIPVLVVAAMAGSAGLFHRHRGDPAAGMRAGALTACGCGLVASLVIGDLPWSQAQTAYSVEPRSAGIWRLRCDRLREAVRLADSPQASVLATSRVASHLLKVRRLEVIGDVLSPGWREAIRREAELTGRGPHWVDVFDWVVLDLNDLRFQHDRRHLNETARAVRAAGFHLVWASAGALVYRRPGTASAGTAAGTDPLASWRVSAAEAAALAGSGRAVSVANDLRLVAWRLTLRPAERQSAGSATAVECELFWQALVNGPRPYSYQLVVGGAGAPAGDTGVRWPTDGNWPTEWWRQGETFRDLFTIELSSPPKGTAADLRAALILRKEDDNGRAVAEHATVLDPGPVAAAQTPTAEP